jgi:hypothetical protein
MTTGRTDGGREQQEDAGFTRQCNCETESGERVVEASVSELPRRRLVYKHTRERQLAEDTPAVWD